MGFLKAAWEKTHHRYKTACGLKKSLIESTPPKNTAEGLYLDLHFLDIIRQSCTNDYVFLVPFGAVGSD